MEKINVNKFTRYHKNHHIQFSPVYTDYYSGYAQKVRLLHGPWIFIGIILPQIDILIDSKHPYYDYHCGDLKQ